MIKGIKVIFDNNGVESRSGAKSVYIRLTDISLMEELTNSVATRIVLNNGRSYIVDDYPDGLIFDAGEKHNKAAVVSLGPINPAMADLHRFKLIKEERQPQSWLGRVFSDAAHFIKGDSEPLPPIRVTHDSKGRKISRAQLRKIYGPNGELQEDFIASQPDLAP